MGRCLGFFEDLGVAVECVMTDNGPGYRSRLFNESLEAHMDHYDGDRPHSACEGPPPVSRIVGVNNVMAHSSLGIRSLASRGARDWGRGMGR